MDPSETVSPPPLVPDSESYTKARLVITRFISLYDHCKRKPLVADWNLSRPHGQQVDAAWYVDFGNKIEFWEWALPFTEHFLTMWRECRKVPYYMDSLGDDLTRAIDCDPKDPLLLELQATKGAYLDHEEQWPKAKRYLVQMRWIDENWTLQWHPRQNCRLDDTLYDAACGRG